MLRVELRGLLRLQEQLRLLRLKPGDRRRVHSFWGKDLQQALRKRVRETVLSSDAELFGGQPRTQKRKAASFARMVGYKATPDAAMLLDKDFARRGHGFAAPRSKDGKATAAQATRLKELGSRWTRKGIRKMPQGVAGRYIRKLEQAQGRGSARRQAGSLILKVWREQGEQILAHSEPAQVLQRFLSAKLKRGR